MKGNTALAVVGEDEDKEALVEEVAPDFEFHAEFKVVRQEGKGDTEVRAIEGYASTKDLDRVQDIVEPEAFRESLKTFMKNPILFYNHESRSDPIGKIVKARIDKKGLFVRAELGMSETNFKAQKVWDMIKEGLLRAFSFGFRITKKEISEDSPIRKILGLDILEVSVVGIGANAHALFNVAKGLVLGSDVMEQGLTDVEEEKLFINRMLLKHYGHSELEEKYGDTNEKQQPGWDVQSVLASKSVYPTVAKAKAAVKKLGYKTSKVDETEQNYRFRQRDPANYSTCRTIQSFEKVKGIKYIYCQRKKDIEPEFSLVSKDAVWSFTSVDGKHLLGDSGDDWATYGKAHFWKDKKNEEVAIGYQLPFAKLVGGRLVAFPQAIITAAEAVQGARGVNIPDEDMAKVKAHIERYYEEMEMTPPWKSSMELLDDEISSGNDPAVGSAKAVFKDASLSPEAFQKLFDFILKRDDELAERILLQSSKSFKSLSESIKEIQSVLTEIRKATVAKTVNNVNTSEESSLEDIQKSLNDMNQTLKDMLPNSGKGQ